MKKLLVINGIPDSPKYQSYENDLESILQAHTDTHIDYFVLRDMNINYCTGCWHCWLKTPGLCSLKDDYEKILKLIPHADDLLIITPVIIGYESALIKKFKDRIIPTALPYIRIVEGEQHHYQRYEKAPAFNIQLIEDEFTVPQDLKLIRDNYERVSLNFDTHVKSFNSSDNAGGIRHVISNL